MERMLVCWFPASTLTYSGAAPKSGPGAAVAANLRRSAGKAYKFFGVDKDDLPREVPMQVKGNIWSFGTEVKSQDKTIMFLSNDEFLSDKVTQCRTEFSEHRPQLETA